MLPLAFGWRDLLFANWRVDAEALDRYVPDPLTVQRRDGSAWLSVVPFVNVDVRPRGLPAALGVDLPEVNLRTYVTHRGEPGVYFCSLDAQGVASVLGARLTHFLPYFYARVELERADERSVRVSSRRRHPGARPARFEATYGPTGEPFEAEPDSLAEFLVERRRLYTLGPRGGVRYTDVGHEPYPLYDAEVEVERNSLASAAGLAQPAGEPRCWYSPGVDVTTTRSVRR